MRVCVRCQRAATVCAPHASAASTSRGCVRVCVCVPTDRNVFRRSATFCRRNCCQSRTHQSSGNVTASSLTIHWPSVCVFVFAKVTRALSLSLELRCVCVRVCRSVGNEARVVKRRENRTGMCDDDCLCAWRATRHACAARRAQELNEARRAYNRSSRQVGVSLSRAV